MTNTTETNGDTTMTYPEYKAARDAEAAAWLEAHAAEMREEAIDTRLEFGCEYFDSAAQDVNLDGMDYYTRLGQASVSEARHTVYSTAPEWTGSPIAVGSENARFIGYHFPTLRPQTSACTFDAEAYEVLPYQGEPRTVRKPSAGRNNSHQINTAEQHRIRQLANKDAQKARRYAKKHQVTLMTAMDALGL